MGFNLKKKLKKVSIKKIGKSAEKFVKQAAIPVAITLATGGTGAAVASTLASTAASRVVAKNIKDPVLSAAVTAATTGSISGSQNLLKDAARAAVTAKVAKQTKSAALGAVVGGTVCGDFKNVTDLTKSAGKEVVREQVTKEVAKKTKNQLLSQAAGAAVGIGMDSIYESFEKKESLPVIQDSNQEEETIKDILPDESVLGELDDAPYTPFPGESKDTPYTPFTGKSEDSPYTPFPNEKPFDTLLDNAGDRLLSKIDNGYNSSGMKSKVTLMSNADSKDPNIRLTTSFKFGNNTTTITQDLKNTKISSINKLTDDYSIGSAVRTSNDLADIRYGKLLKSGNQTRETGVGFDRKGIWDSEAYAYTSLKTDVKTDVVGACVLKETMKQNISVPLCGNVGTLSQQTLTCSDSITVTDKLGLNANAGLCGVSMIPAARGASLAAKGGSALLKQGGKLAGTFVIEEVAPAGYAFAIP